MANLWNDILTTDVMQSDGYVVDYAVLTTYSLDLPTLLSVPFALGAMPDLTDTMAHSPHLILEAVSASTDKFAVFCNAGSIAVPQANNLLYSLLESNVVQVGLSARGRGFINFHPKVWIVRETNPDTAAQQLKVVVLSRNLTGSNDLDVVCELVAPLKAKPVSDEAQAKHKPLADFMAWLAERASSKIRKHLHDLIADVARVERFDVTDSPFQDYAFSPMGIEGYDGMEVLKRDMLDHAAEMVVISPFIDEPTLRMMQACSPKARKTLITRHASVTNEVISLFNDGVYAPKEVLTDKAERDVAVDLHEKVYFVHNSRTYINKLYLGSTNATRNGFDRNVEFLVRLDFKFYKTSYDAFRKELIYDKSDCLFEHVDAVPADEAVTQDALTSELLLRQAISVIQKAEIAKTPSGYSVTIRCHKTSVPAVTIRPYTLPPDTSETLLTDGLTFEGIEERLLTQFYVVSVGELKRLIKLPTTGLPFEARDKAIFRSVVNSREKFVSYLAFMLTDDANLYLPEDNAAERALAEQGAADNERKICSALYEDMVKAAYYTPERLKSIRSLMEKVDPAVVPPHFGDMYATFEKALRQIRRL